MMNIIACDLGTGGVKASLVSGDGLAIARSFVPYDTFYKHSKWHEQRPPDWWQGVCMSVRNLLEQARCTSAGIAGVALSGHSLVTVPLDKEGKTLAEYVPIWSDTRATAEADGFFRDIDYEDWYTTTGNGDPPACYSIFKLMWMKKHQSELFNSIDTVLGSKDYINYRLTGVKCTDPSYASGSGAFNLKKWDYEDRFIRAARIPRNIFPPLRPSDAIIGRVTPEASALTGLPQGLPVICGAVDNACMALGATGTEQGRAYISLGSSAWIAVTSSAPALDVRTRPFVFAHAVRGLYTSGVSIFSAGSSLRWARDQLCRDLARDEDAYDLINEMAAGVPVGSRGVLFNPTLAGGSAQEAHPDTRGSFAGLSLSTTREDMVRAVMEGVALALCETFESLKPCAGAERLMLMCGGGSKSPLWRTIFASVFGMSILKTNIDQDAATLGAASLVANACGLWPGYGRIGEVHITESITEPLPHYVSQYAALRVIYREWSDRLALIPPPA
ncbi:MAG: pentose kinase [Tannerellaceae bacterium]|jgi:xylulokinase|nr:pentose kinase [Tannerellaceae bacterium]